MRKQYLAAIAVAIVVGGAGLWWWLHGSQERTSDLGPRASGEKQRSGGPRPEARGPDPEVAVLVDDDPRGELRLEGQVVDSDEHPVAGATVVLSANPPRTATTEADGAFAFDALVGRPYTLVARAK